MLEILRVDYIVQTAKALIRLCGCAGWSEPLLIEHALTLKAPSKFAADGTFIFYLYLFKKIRLDVSCESSARQRIHMKHQVLFSQKNNETIFMNVVCCSRDWRFKG